jgi:peroxiredoxin
MFRSAIAALLVLGLAQVSPVRAADLKIGDAAPAFSKLAGVDGKMHSLADYTHDVLVVAITCNHCPVAVAYEDRIIDFAKKHTNTPGSKVGLVAINVNNTDQDKLDKMVERSKEKGFNFDYIYDPSQKIARELGARVTPEFFVFDKDRKLVYHGAFDNSQKDPTENYLEPAVKAALAGTKPAIAETTPKGCGVKYEK